MKVDGIFIDHDFISLFIDDNLHIFSFDFVTIWVHEGFFAVFAHLDFQRAPTFHDGRFFLFDQLFFINKNLLSIIAYNDLHVICVDFLAIFVYIDLFSIFVNFHTEFTVR